MKTKHLIFAALIFALALAFQSCFNDDDDVQNIQTLAEEQALLSEYLDTLAGRGYDIDTTALGVYYIVLEEGEGDFPRTGDVCEVSYTGLLMNFYPFDSSYKNAQDTTWTFTLGASNLINGWNDGMKVLNKGAKAFLIIPSTLAYGEAGMGIIPPNNTILFEVKMVDITFN